MASTLTAVPAQASSFTYDSPTHTYTYTGGTFNFCGFGCVPNAPANWSSDFLTITLTYAAELAPNLTNASPVPLSWTMHDFLNSFNFVGTGLPNGSPGDNGDPPIPGLVLSTDANRNIVSWIVSASSGSSIRAAVLWARGPSFSILQSFAARNALLAE